MLAKVKKKAKKKAGKKMAKKKAAKKKAAEGAPAKAWLRRFFELDCASRAEGKRWVGKLVAFRLPQGPIVYAWLHQAIGPAGAIPDQWRVQVGCWGTSLEAAKAVVQSILTSKRPRKGRRW